jgi:signal transduction histidine kinase
MTAGLWAARLAARLGGYAAAVSIVRSLSRAFNHYMSWYLGDWLRMGSALSLPLFGLCVAVFLASVWKSKGRRPPPWRDLDISVLSVLGYCAVVLCVYCARDGAQWHEPINRQLYLPLPLLSAAAYAIAMALLAEWAARLRDRHFALCWPRFFKLCPIRLRQPMGLLMALLLAGDLLYLVVIFPLGALRAHLSLAAVLASAFALSALTYVAGFVLSLSAEYDKASAEKLRAERFKAELITNVSHDIRTPLTSIINYVDLLKALPVERADFAEYVGILDSKAARLKTLIGDLMEASKAGTGNMSVDLREMDLAEIIGQIAGEFDDRFAERGLTLVLRQPDQPVLVQADSSHLWRALENLFGNAAKYALPGTRVFAEIGYSGGAPIFSLKNTSQAHIDLSGDALAEQFMRGDRSRQTEGSGLGLYIAKSLVELMGGRFAIHASGDLFEVAVYPKSPKRNAPNN